MLHTRPQYSTLSLPPLPLPSHFSAIVLSHSCSSYPFPAQTPSPPSILTLFPPTYLLPLLSPFPFPSPHLFLPLSLFFPFSLNSASLTTALFYHSRYHYLPHLSPNPPSVSSPHTPLHAPGSPSPPPPPPPPHSPQPISPPLFPIPFRFLSFSHYKKKFLRN